MIRRLLLVLACVLFARVASAQTPTPTAATGCHYSVFTPLVEDDTVQIWAEPLDAEYPPEGDPSFNTGPGLYMVRGAGDGISLAAVRYDTSTLPDDASIISATQTLYGFCIQAETDELSLVAGWSGGEAPWSAGDYAAVAETSAFPEGLLSLVDGPLVGFSPILYTVNLTLTGDDTGVDRTGYTALKWWISNSVAVPNNNECSFEPTSPDYPLAVYWCEAGVPTPVATATFTAPPGTETATGTVTATRTVTATGTDTPVPSDTPTSTVTPLDTETPVPTPVNTPTALPPIYELQSFYGTETCPGAPLSGYDEIATGHVYATSGMQQPEDQCVIDPPTNRRLQQIGNCVVCSSRNTYDTFVEWGSPVCHTGLLGEYYPPVMEQGKQYQWKHLATDGQCWKTSPDHGAGALSVVGSCAVCSGAGPTFTVAGRSTCPNDATLVYTGKAYVGRGQQTSLQCWRSPPNRPSTELGDCAVCAIGGTGPRPYSVWGTTTCPGGDTALVTGNGYRYGVGQLDSACWQQAPKVAATAIGTCALCLGNGNDYVFAGSQTCPSPDTALATGYVRTFASRTHMRNACWVGAPTAASTVQGLCAVCEASDRVSTLYGVSASRGCPASSSEVLEGFTYLCDEGANNSACWSTAPGLVPTRGGGYTPLDGHRSPCDQTIPCVTCRGVSEPWP